MPPRRAHSISGDSNMSDDEGGTPENQANGKKGQASSGSAKELDQRKAQNRIAQREFRQRKQQYVRSLEARLALKEATADDQYDQMKVALGALMDENQKLRELLASLAGFVGEGLGGVLPKMNIDNAAFQDLIHRDRRDQILKALEEKQGTAGSHKRPRGSGDTDSPVEHPTFPPFHTPEYAPSFTAPLETYRPSASLPPAQFQPIASTSSLAAPTSAIGLPTSFPSYSESLDALPYTQPLTLHPPAALAPPMTESPDQEEQRANDIVGRLPTHPQYEGRGVYDDEVRELFSMPTDNPKLQAIQLISYHMRNKREQPGYHLPPSLRATVTQQSVPHSEFYDGIIFAGVRDRLILMKDQFSIPTLLHDLIEACAIHEDDILLPANWEVSESFIRKYWYIIDDEVLGCTNRWRRERGEPELTLREIVPDGAEIAAEGKLGKKARD